MSTNTIQVLLVEDNLADARLLYEGLEEALPGQFQMTHIRRLDEALEHLWKQPCDVVLLDLGLPDSHGVDTLVLTRAQAPKVPIIVLTGFHDEALGDQALKEGAQDYLVKGQDDGKRLARAMRYAISRMTVAEALAGQQFAFAKARVLRRSRSRLIAAHERVRRDIATRLYNGVQKNHVTIKSRLQELIAQANPSTETSRELATVIDGLDHQIARQVSELSQELYPTTLGDGLIPTFNALRDRFGVGLKLTVAFNEELKDLERFDPASLPEKVALAAYRIAEEALDNVAEHAVATRVLVRLDACDDGFLRLSIQDNGHGFDTAQPTFGLGIGTMQDYAESVDGQCWIHSDKSAGTEVTAVLPLSGPEATQLTPSPTGAH
jgi:signal transduction histidine kinase